MDQNTRNTLRNVVTQCRRLLEDSVAQVLQGQFGMFAIGKKDEVQIEPEARMSHLSEEDRAYRQDLLDHFEHIKALGYRAKDALAQLIREVAFTHLNRFCAYRMMESRGLIRESVSKGLKSQGFLFYLADHEEDERRYNTGQQDLAYRHFLNWLGGTLSEEIGVLFAPTDPANRLYPPQRVIDEVLGLLNDPELAGIWSEDEAIGWVYQYFTPKELRDQARKESQAPRNSYELAFRNQFFTPRYVVEFLTDNTLGRIWYEMRRGDTRLKDLCRYMVRRPTEVFLKEGEKEPDGAATATDDLSQEDLLRLPVYVPFREKKDPRELRILDPACGSGHFLLYCFDLLITIYEEAYSDSDLGTALKKDYETLEDLRRDVPRLILAHNLHGIDIDPRASQIAALALWLRCQRAYQEMGIKQDRPKITRSNVVCAEPMPGEERMLKEFVDQLEPTILGQVVEVVFETMKLAGEAGSLLKIEEEIRDAVTAAKKQYARETTQATDRKGRAMLFSEAEMERLADGAKQASLFHVSDITDSAFFEQAETRIIDALQLYAEDAHARQELSRSLFGEDTVQGFAFVDTCRKRYDVVLMNPPFGDPSLPANTYLQQQYLAAKHDLASAFIERAAALLAPQGLVGSITTRTLFYLSYLSEWRKSIAIDGLDLRAFADFGDGVLDATIETAAHVFQERSACRAPAWFARTIDDASRQQDLLGAVTNTALGSPCAAVFLCDPSTFAAIDRSPFAYNVPDSVRRAFGNLPPFQTDVRRGFIGALTQDDFRFLRAWWETDPQLAARNWTLGTHAKWVPYTKGGSYTPYYADYPLTMNWANDGEELKAFLTQYRREKGFADQWTSQLNAYERYFLPGLTWSSRPNPQGSFWALPTGVVFGNSGPAVQSDKPDLLWLLAVMNTRVFRSLLDLLMPRGATSGQSLKYELGYVRAVPVPHGDEVVTSKAASLVSQCIQALRTLDGVNEFSHAYAGPLLCSIDRATSLRTLLESHKTLHAQHVAAAVDASSSIERLVEPLFSLSYAALSHLYGGTAAEAFDSFVQHNALCAPQDDRQCVEGLLSYCLGIVFGRWDVRYQPDQSTTVDPFAALPVCSAAMLVGSDGLPSIEVPTGYPLKVDRDGICPEDSTSADDIVASIDKALAYLFGADVDSIEREICNAVGTKTIREYIRKPGKGGAWDCHLETYSKSRRKAPIYWLLQSAKKNYAIWLYYHRLDKDILFKALVNYVEPKIRLENDRLQTLRAQKGEGGTGKSTKKLDKEIEKQEEFLSELRDFEEKLRRAADLHLVPDLNDGVVLNIAPLHELVPWKEAEKYWEQLLEGKYEWSSIGKQLREKDLVK